MYKGVKFGVPTIETIEEDLRDQIDNGDLDSMARVRAMKRSL